MASQEEGRVREVDDDIVNAVVTEVNSATGEDYKQLEEQYNQEHRLYLEAKRNRELLEKKKRELEEKQQKLIEALEKDAGSELTTAKTSSMPHGKISSASNNVEIIDNQQQGMLSHESENEQNLSNEFSMKVSVEETSHKTHEHNDDEEPKHVTNDDDDQEEEGIFSRLMAYVSSYFE